MCAKWQICIIKTVGEDDLTRFCLEEEEELDMRISTENSVSVLSI